MTDQSASLKAALAVSTIITSQQDIADEKLICYLPNSYKTYDQYMRAKRSRLTGLLQCSLVSTVSFTNQTSGTGIVTGSLVNVGGGTITEVGAVFSTTINPTIAISKVTVTLIQNGTFVVTIIPGAGDIYARAFVTNNVGTFYGDSILTTIT